LKQFDLEDTYSDSPQFANELLLPALEAGRDINLVSAFAPSYLFKLVRNLASRKDQIPGYLHLTLFVRGDLKLKSEGIARLKHYLGRYAENEVQVAQFVEDCLKLLTATSNKCFELSVLHAEQKKPVTKSLMGVIFNVSTWPDMVTFIDAKAGDFNSPVSPKRSWLDEEYLETLETYTKVRKLTSGEQGRLVGEQELVSWLEYLSDWYEKNPPTQEEEEEEELEELEDEQIFERQEDFIEFLQDFGEFQKEGSFEYGDEPANEFDWDDWFDRGGKEAEVFPSEAVNGHIPPILGNFNAQVLGTAKATCVCGQVFTRIYGCSKVDW
jgi:hypothetical protein